LRAQRRRAGERREELRLESRERDVPQHAAGPLVHAACCLEILDLAGLRDQRPDPVGLEMTERVLGAPAKIPLREETAQELAERADDPTAERDVGAAELSLADQQDHGGQEERLIWLRDSLAPVEAELTQPREEFVDWIAHGVRPLPRPA